MSRHILALAACLLAGTTIAHLQQPSAADERQTFRSGVDVVQLDVTVLDKDRRPVRGLTAADFTVLKDGKPRPIVGFAAVDLEAPEPPSASWMREIAPDVVSNDLEVQRFVVIVMDDAQSGVSYAWTPGPMRARRDPWGEFYDPAIAVTAKQIARDVVDRLGPNDLAAVAFTYSGRRQNLTNDRARLRAAVDSFMPKSIPEPALSPEMVMLSPRRPWASWPVSASPPSGGPSSGATPGSGSRIRFRCSQSPAS